MVRRRQQSETNGGHPRRKAGKYIRALMCIAGRRERVVEDKNGEPLSSGQHIVSPRLPHPSSDAILRSQRPLVEEEAEDTLRGNSVNEEKERLVSVTKVALSKINDEKDLSANSEQELDLQLSSNKKEADSNHPPSLDHSSLSSTQSNHEKQLNFGLSQELPRSERNEIPEKPPQVDTSLAISSGKTLAWDLESPENDNPSPNAALSLQTLLGSSKTISRSSKPIASSPVKSQSGKGKAEHQAVSSLLSSSRFISSPKRRNSFSDRIEKRLMDMEGSLNRSHSTLDKEGLGKVQHPSDPHSYLIHLVQERGYEAKTYKALSTAYYNKPTSFQMASYGQALIQAVRMNDVEEFHELLEHLSCNPCTSRGESLVHMLCRRGNNSQLELLLNRADGMGWSQAVDVMGRTPLHDCCWRNDGNTDLPRLLLDRNPVLLLLEDAKGVPPLSYVPSQQWELWTKLLDENIEKWFPAEPYPPGTREVFSAGMKLARGEPNSVPLEEQAALPLDEISRIAAVSRLNNSRPGPVGIISSNSLMVDDYVSDLDDSTGAEEGDQDDFSVNTEKEEDDEEDENGVARSGIAHPLIISL